MSQSLKAACEFLINDITDTIEHGRQPYIGVSTGFAKLDDVIGGWRKEALYIIAGRTSMGKSSLALWSAIHAAMNGETVLMISMEMSAQMIALRTLSGLTGIPGYNIEHGLLSKDDLKNLNTALALVAEMQFTIVDESMTSEEFAIRVLSLQQKRSELGLVFVDYGTLFRDRGSFGEHDRLSRISKNMLALCHEAKLPVVMLAQLNRAVENREDHIPILSDLRESGSLEEDSYAVLFGFRPAYYENIKSDAPPKDVEYDAKIIVAKNRQGPIGQIKMTFHAKLMRWSDDAPKVGNPPSLKERV